MEETQTNFSQNQEFEPTEVDNSDVEFAEVSQQVMQEGQSTDPSSELILGKFKSVEDLTKAYQELQRFQGESSEELGRLRRESDSVQDFVGSIINAIGIRDQLVNSLKEAQTKYDNPEYFQDANFKELYREAFSLLGENLDADKFVNLLENYVNSRFALKEKSQQAELETQNILDSMTYSKNPKSTLMPPEKSLDEMTPQEVDELLERLI